MSARHVLPAGTTPNYKTSTTMPAISSASRRTHSPPRSGTKPNWIQPLGGAAGAVSSRPTTSSRALSARGGNQSNNNHVSTTTRYQQLQSERLYTEALPRDAVNSMTNRTKGHTIWPKPHYVPTVVQRYRQNGSRDAWIEGNVAETQGKHFVSDTELYWQSKLQQPEFRGRCKPALCSVNDRFILYPHLKKVHNHPMVPKAAQEAQMANAMPPVKRTVFSGAWRAVEEVANRNKCDMLMMDLMMTKS